MNINTNISSLVDNMAYAIGGQSSAITLTPNQIDIMSKNINLTGKVTIDSLSSGMRDMFSTENGKTVILDGVERMHHRPIGQLVDALREIGADIEYLGEEGSWNVRI